MFKEIILGKHAKKFVSKGKAASPILEGLHYGADGSIYATNRNYALRIRNAHNFDSPVTLHAKTGVPIEGQYPNIAEVFANAKFSDEFTFTDNEELKQAFLAADCALSIALKINKHLPLVQMVNSFGDIMLLAQNSESTILFKGRFGKFSGERFPEIHLNGEYLVNALGVFLEIPFDFGAVKVRFSESTNPILITDDTNADVLIMPFRKVEL